MLRFIDTVNKKIKDAAIIFNQQILACNDFYIDFQISVPLKKATSVHQFIGIMILMINVCIVFFF